MKQSIGIDISKDFIDVCFFDGKSYHSKKYDTNSKAIVKKFLKDFCCNTKETRITMEATGVYHLVIATYLYELGYEVSVVNPLIIKRYSQMKMGRAKTDAFDAKLISEYGMSEYHAFRPRPQAQEELLQVFKMIEYLQQTKSQYNNRLHALKKNPKKSSIVEKSIKKILKNVQNEIIALESTLDEKCKEFNSEQYLRQMTINGVGKKLSAVLLAYFGEFEQFESSKQVIAYIGTNPSPYQSGSSQRKNKGISKKGHNQIRKILYMAALSSTTHSPACKDFYDRLVARGKNKRLAIIAVANKLMRQLFSIVKNGAIYDPEYYRKFQKNEGQSLDFSHST